MEKKTKMNLKEKIETPEQLAIQIKTNIIVVIKISASWCGPCKNKEFLERYHNLKDNWISTAGIKFIELDIDDNEYILTNKDYYDIDINIVPSFLVSKNGSFTRKYSGTKYLDMINQYIKESVV